MNETQRPRTAHPEKDTPAGMLAPGWQVYRNSAWHTIKRVQSNQRGSVYVECEDVTYLIPQGDLVPAEMS